MGARQVMPLTPLDEAWNTSVELRDHLMQIPFHVDVGTPDKPAAQSPIVQIVFHVNRQNYLSFLSCLETDHVIPAAQLTRSLLEESIKWEWMTDDPKARIRALFGDFRRCVDAIRAECVKLGVDPRPFINPSPFGDTSTLGPFEQGAAFPPVAEMIRQTEAKGKADLAQAGVLGSGYSIQALYAQYRVLSQLTHTSLLGMTTTIQPDEKGTVAVGRDLPPVWRALLLHTSAASAMNVAAYTVSAFEESPGSGRFLAWVFRARELAFRIAEVAGPIHRLTASL